MTVSAVDIVKLADNNAIPRRTLQGLLNVYGIERSLRVSLCFDNVDDDRNDDIVCISGDEVRIADIEA